MQELLESAVLFENVSETHVVSTPLLLIVEKQLLNLSSYQSCTKGIFYCLQVLVEGNAKKVLYISFSLCCFSKRFYKLIFGESGPVD